MSGNGVRHFLDLIDIPRAELRGIIAKSRAIKALAKVSPIRPIRSILSFSCLTSISLVLSLCITSQWSASLPRNSRSSYHSE